jgi:hypothetical protein
MGLEEDQQRVAATGAAVIDLNQQSITRPVGRRPEVLSQASTSTATLDDASFSTFRGPNLLSTTGASAQPVNTDKPEQGEKVSIIEDAITKTGAEKLGGWLHHRLLNSIVIPENAEGLRWVPNSDEMRKNGVTLGEMFRAYAIPIVAVCDALSSKVRENGYGAVLTWFKRPVEDTQADEGAGRSKERREADPSKNNNPKDSPNFQPNDTAKMIAALEEIASTGKKTLEQVKLQNDIK